MHCHLQCGTLQMYCVNYKLCHFWEKKKHLIFFKCILHLVVLFSWCYIVCRFTLFCFASFKLYCIQLKSVYVFAMQHVIISVSVSALNQTNMVTRRLRIINSYSQMQQIGYLLEYWHSSKGTQKEVKYLFEIQQVEHV